MLIVYIIRETDSIRFESSAENLHLIHHFQNFFSLTDKWQCNTSTDGTIFYVEKQLGALLQNQYLLNRYLNYFIEQKIPFILHDTIHQEKQLAALPSVEITHPPHTPQSEPDVNASTKHISGLLQACSTSQPEETASHSSSYSTQPADQPVNHTILPDTDTETIQPTTLLATEESLINILPPVLYFDYTDPALYPFSQTNSNQDSSFLPSELPPIDPDVFCNTSEIITPAHETTSSENTIVSSPSKSGNSSSNAANVVSLPKEISPSETDCDSLKTNKKTRKNFRERERRTEIKQGFDSIYTLLIEDIRDPVSHIPKHLKTNNYAIQLRNKASILWASYDYLNHLKKLIPTQTDTVQTNPADTAQANRDKSKKRKAIRR